MSLDDDFPADRERTPGELAFPLYSRTVFERSVNRTFFPVGVMDDYPNELLQRVSAATLSYAMQLKSMDYTRKTYIKDFEYERDTGNRHDRTIEDFCTRFCEFVSLTISKQNEVVGSEQPLGRVIADFTLARLQFSVGEAIAVAHRGALYECLAILRMLLEQFSWALAVKDFDHRERIFDESPMRSVSKVKAAHDGFGKLYGWLSNHAHWSYDAQLKTLDLSSERVQTRLANSEFKAIALCATCTLIYMASFAVQIFYKEEFADRSEKLIKFRAEWIEIRDDVIAIFAKNRDIRQLFEIAAFESVN